MSDYRCSACDEEFATLSAKRLHDCPRGAAYGGDEPDATHNVDDVSQEELIDIAVEEALECDICGVKSDGANDYDQSISDAGVSVTLAFRCSNCEAWNENTVVFE